jgi:NADH dehydrogenase (ubiquinone) 1 beta subcomplex subunit 7
MPDFYFFKSPIYLQEEMHAANIDMVNRDFCAHLLIPLNECRRKSFYLPWKCEHERHAYELCQYNEYKRRVAMADEERKAAKKG